MCVCEGEWGSSLKRERPERTFGIPVLCYVRTLYPSPTSPWEGPAFGWSSETGAGSPGIAYWEVNVGTRMA